MKTGARPGTACATQSRLPDATPNRDAGKAAHSLLDRGALRVLLALLLLFIGPAAAWLIWMPKSTLHESPPLEVRLLVYSVLLSLVLPIAQIVFHIRRFGGDWVRGNREETIGPSGAAGRIVRAHANLIESLLPFATLVMVAQACGALNRFTAAAAAVFMVARLMHAVSYSFGITIVRSAAFYAGWLATIVIGLQLPFWR